jgi:hypothetical protein
MTRECLFYHTAPPNICGCCEKEHANALFRTKFPCLDIVFMGEVQEEFDPPRLKYKATIDKLIILRFRITVNIAQPVE